MSPPATTDSSTTRRPPNRRDLILRAAVRLFHERGYPATSVDDIGKAVDVSGPAIYRHFASKEDLLLEAIRMAADEVQAIHEGARAETADPRDLLRAYIRAYVGVAIERSDMIAVWNSEARHLARERRSPTLRRLRSWSQDWVVALQRARPELDEPSCRLRVSAAIGLVTSVATGPDTGLAPDALADAITAMAMATLDTPATEPRPKDHPCL